jgi:1,5-rhamnosyltransferase
MTKTGKINFVFFSNPYFGYDYAFSDIMALKNVITITRFPPSGKKIVRLLYKIHHTPRINKFIRLPLKSLWFKIYLNFSVSSEGYLCFIINELWTERTELEYLKRKYPNGRFVLHIFDIAPAENKLIEYGKIYKDFFDLVIDYDERQAIKFNLDYFPSVHSYFGLNSAIFNFKKYCPVKHNVYFCGRSINRLDKLLAIFEYLRSHGISCDFHITDVWPHEMKYRENIVYNKNLTYVEHMNHLVNSDCILYIHQDDADSYEWRIINAIMYNKKIITNVKALRNTPFFNPDHIAIIQEPEDLSIEFLANVHKPADYNYDVTNFSPLRLLEYITTQLFKE